MRSAWRKIHRARWSFEISRTVTREQPKPVPIDGQLDKCEIFLRDRLRV
jgi:hypothetical protein